jgi:hypothetical protein
MRTTTGSSLLLVGSLALIGCGGEDKVAAADSAPHGQVHR